LHQDAEAPPVGAEVVALAANDLGGHVLDRAAERVGLVFQGFLGKTEVCDGDVAAGVLWKDEKKKFVRSNILLKHESHRQSINLTSK
jgi:hypothetical protein